MQVEFGYSNSLAQYRDVRARQDEAKERSVAKELYGSLLPSKGKVKQRVAEYCSGMDGFGEVE